jgi:hypothetical protein
MKRTAFAGVGLVVVMSARVPLALAQSQTSILISGQSAVIIDTNGNGMPDASDGRLAGVLASSNLSFLGLQGSGAGTHLLRALTGGFQFDVVQFMPTLAVLQQTGAPGVMPPISPNRFASISASLPSGSSTYTHLAIQTGGQSSGGSVCQSGGSPAAQVTLGDGLTMDVGLGFFPSPGNAAYLTIPNVPFQETNGQKFFTTIFIPVSNNAIAGAGSNKITLAPATTPGSPFFTLNLGALPSCAISPPGVPTLSAWVLILAMLVLVGLGVRSLGRRPSFYASLALP